MTSAHAILKNKLAVKVKHSLKYGTHIVYLFYLLLGACVGEGGGGG